MTVKILNGKFHETFQNNKNLFNTVFNIAKHGWVILDID